MNKMFLILTFKIILYTCWLFLLLFIQVAIHLDGLTPAVKVIHPGWRQHVKSVILKNPKLNTITNVHYIMLGMHLSREFVGWVCFFVCFCVAAFWNLRSEYWMFVTDKRRRCEKIWSKKKTSIKRFHSKVQYLPLWWQYKLIDVSTLQYLSYFQCFCGGPQGFLCGW